MSYPSSPPSPYGNLPGGPPQPERQGLPIPFHKPFVTYVLLAIIGIVWLLVLAVDNLSGTSPLIAFGANAGWLILIDGEIWRLFTSMFLHERIDHFAFNAFALFIFGLEMERLYGPDRFTVVYILSGLFGSLLSFGARGPNVLSIGASGAIFGVIGMNLAFFLLHRNTFGRFGRQRMTSTLIIIGINLVFGFTVPGIDNYAHLGGLISGFALGYGLAPRYEIDRYSVAPRVTDTVSLLNRWWVPALGVILLSAGVYGAMVFWLTVLS